MLKMAKNAIFLSILLQFIQKPDMLRKFCQQYCIQRDKIFGIYTMVLQREKKIFFYGIVL